MKEKICSNPCCTGILIELFKYNFSSMEYTVLILVVLEY